MNVRCSECISSARSMTACAHRSTSSVSPLSGAWQRSPRTTTRPSALGRRSTRPGPCISDASRDASMQAIAQHVFHRQPCHTHCQRGFVVRLRCTAHAALRTVPRYRGGISAKMLPHISVRGAIRIASTIRRIGRQRIGHLERTLPTELRGGDVTVDRPPACPHVPLVGGTVRSPAASKCSAISAAFWSS